MALTIGPTVRGVSRGKQLVAHGLGLLLGSTVMALALTLIGEAIDSGSLSGSRGVEISVAIVLGLWALRVQTGFGLPFPSSRWQVPEHWRASLPPYMTLTLFGFLLGLGFLTSVVFPLYWVLLGGTLLIENLVVALAAWLAYAGMRLYATLIALRKADGAESYAEMADVAPNGWKAIRTLCSISLLGLSLLLVL